MRPLFSYSVSAWRWRSQRVISSGGHGDCKPTALPPEDASVLALATFGTDKEGRILGMHMVVTFDQSMVTHWAVQRTAIQTRLTAMQQELLMPYRQASLPEVLLPAQMARGVDPA
jgi:hypothetical protein